MQKNKSPIWWALDKEVIFRFEEEEKGRHKVGESPFQFWLRFEDSAFPVDHLVDDGRRRRHGRRKRKWHIETWLIISLYLDENVFLKSFIFEIGHLDCCWWKILDIYEIKCCKIATTIYCMILST